MAEQAVVLEEVKRGVRKAPLFFRVDGKRCLECVTVARGADFDKDDRSCFERYDVQLAAFAAVVTGKDAVAEVLEMTNRFTFGAVAEPTLPPWLADEIEHERRCPKHRSRFGVTESRQAASEALSDECID